MPKNVQGKSKIRGAQLTSSRALRRTLYCNFEYCSGPIVGTSEALAVAKYRAICESTRFFLKYAYVSDHHAAKPECVLVGSICAGRKCSPLMTLWPLSPTTSPCTVLRTQSQPPCRLRYMIRRDAMNCLVREAKAARNRATAVVFSATVVDGNMNSTHRECTRLTCQR